MTREGTEWSLVPASGLGAGWWQDWDRLNTSGLSGHPLLRSSMVALLVEHFGKDSLLFASLRHGGEVLAQTIVEPSSRFKYGLFSPSQSPISLLVFKRGLAAGEALRFLMASLPSYCMAFYVPYQDEPFSVFQGAAVVGVERESLGTTISVSCKEGFESYWLARPRDLRQNVRRYLKRAEQENVEIRFVTYSSPDDIPAAVDRFGILESAGWKGGMGTALHPDNQQGRFYRKLLADAAGRDEARAFELYMGGTLAASRLMISGPTMHVMLKTAYDEGLRRLAPGRLLLHFALEELMKDTARREVEFYTRANEDMLQWATHTRGMESVTVFRSGAVRQLLRVRAWVKSCLGR